MSVAKIILENTRGETEGEKVANILGDFVNSGGMSDFKDFVSGILRQHRTLQQMIFTCFMLCVKGWADQRAKGWYDARNEFTVTVCEDIVDKVEEIREYTRAPLI